MNRTPTGEEFRQPTEPEPPDLELTPPGEPEQERRAREAARVEGEEQDEPPE